MVGSQVFFFIFKVPNLHLNVILENNTNNHHAHGGVGIKIMKKLHVEGDVVR